MRFLIHAVAGVSIVTERLSFVPQPFIPHPLLKNAHLQTVAADLIRSKRGVSFRRVRLETPDDDFLDVDFAEVNGATWAQLGDDAPLLFFLHGLEGSARRGYAFELYRQAAEAGWRSVGINYRSCSGVLNRQPRFYHMGATADVRLVFDWLLSQYPDVPVVMVGVSLGGNILLKFLGEYGADLDPRVRGAAAISPPLIATGTQKINDDRMGRLYGMYLLRKLKAKVRKKADTLKMTAADVYGALTARTLRDFDDAITAPLHGFADAEDYYARSQSANFISAIDRPTLILRAQDDPFFNRDIPFDVIAANPHLYGVFPEQGGHVGFVAADAHPHWAQQQAVSFLTRVLVPV